MIPAQSTIPPTKEAASNCCSPAWPPDEGAWVGFSPPDGLSAQMLPEAVSFLLAHSRVALAATQNVPVRFPALVQLKKTQAEEFPAAQHSAWFESKLEQFTALEAPVVPLPAPGAAVETASVVAACVVAASVVSLPVPVAAGVVPLALPVPVAAGVVPLASPVPAGVVVLAASQVSTASSDLSQDAWPVVL